MLERVEQLFGDTLQFLLLVCFWAAYLTTAVVECNHARNRRLIHHNHNWPMFSALCTLADAKNANKVNMDTGKGTNVVSAKARLSVSSDGVAREAHVKQVS